MTQLPHGLVGDFPDAVDRILELESEAEDFVRLAEAYEAITAELQDIECGIEPACRAYMAQLRRQRDALRQTLFARLNA
jgi:hypothetical protein